MCAVRYTPLRMVDCEVSENSATQIGGGGVWVFEPATFERVSFIANTTPRSGGGLLLRRWGHYNFINCTFSGNKAASGIEGHNVGGGGAIYTQEDATVHIYNSTISGNIIQGTSTNHQGGGIYSYGTAAMFMHGSIAAGNQGNSHGYDDVSGVFTAVTNCLIQVTNGVALPGANNIFDQPALLEALADNGGPTRTHALNKDSPAIDNGTNPLGLTTDQRGDGFARLLGSAVDIGAYEFQPAPFGTVISIR